MPKFSIVVPVYNVEKYLKKCLDSIKNQTYKDYEVIIVNDGTKDNSMDIVKDYDFKVINEDNEGLSQARNNGIKKAQGEYLVFVDSDDYIEKDLLKELEKSTDNNPDIIRYQVREVRENNLTDYNEEPFNNKNGVEAFKLITKYHYVEPAWCYAIKREYYEKEKFSFKKGAFHEDFGLIPLVIMKANVVNSISYIGYNYIKRENSIMSNTDYNKTLKKVEDFYNHYNYLVKEIDNTKLDFKYFKSFISNSLILKITELNDTDYHKYLNKLKEDKVFDNLLEDTLSRKIKKRLISLSPKIYYRKK